MLTDLPGPLTFLKVPSFCPFNLGLILGPFGVGSFAFRASAPKAEWGLVLPTGTTLSLAETGLSFPLVAGIEAPELIVPALKETLLCT